MSGRNVTRRRLLQAMGGGAALLASRPVARAFAGEPAKKPNFVFILVDDLGWADIGCYGSRYYETPSIDKLASGGMLFTNAYAACAVCSPTRASIMTGRYPARLGVTDWIRSRFQGGKIPEDKKNPTEYVGDKKQKLLCPPNALWMELDEITIAEMLKPTGYVSCHVGKWHLGADDWYPDKQGFDYNIGGCDFGQPPTYFDPYFRKGQGGIPTLEPRKAQSSVSDHFKKWRTLKISDPQSSKRGLFLTVLYPRPKHAPSPIVKRLAGDNYVGAGISGESFLFATADKPISGEGIQSDGKVVGIGRQSGKPAWVLCVGGTRLTVDDEDVLRADKPVTAAFNAVGDGSITTDQPAQVTISIDQGRPLKLKAEPGTTTFHGGR